jgi:hypothetical protein
MVKLHIAIIHGIGKNGPGFSRDLTERIRREFKRALQKILKISDDHSGDLNFIEVIWDDILAVNQARLADIFRKEFKRRDQSEKMNFASWVLMVFVVAAVSSFIFKNPWIVALIAFGAFPFVKSVFVKLRTDIAAEFIDDIICYREKVAQKMILDRVEERLRSCGDFPGGANVHFISHSLGTVIASDYVWEAQKPGNFLNQKTKVGNFFTMGSPLPLFSLQFGGPELFNKPFVIQDEAGRWVNIYDRDDPIAYPLKCLNDAYDRTVLKDQEVDVGWFGLAHVNYWKSEQVARLMAHKFALDWLRENRKLPADKILELSERYDTTLDIFSHHG